MASGWSPSCLFASYYSDQYILPFLIVKPSVTAAFSINWFGADVCMCVSAPSLLITSGVMWHDMDPYDWLIKFYTCYMAVVVIINDGRGLRIETLHINQHNKGKLALYKPLYSL